MKPVILIGSCKKDWGSGGVQALRETWLRDCPIPYVIFYGRTVIAACKDEVTLDCPDGLWDELTFKTREMMRWVRGEGYTHIFRCDVDTLVNTKRLVLAIPAHDYCGSTLNTPKVGEVDGVPYPFCHGGPGMWLSERAVYVLANSPVDPKKPEDKLQDQWIGKHLLAAGIVPVHDRRFSMGSSYGRHEPAVLASNDVISCHLGAQTGKYEPQQMYKAYGRSQKVLIACSSCWRDVANGSDAAIRETWGRELPAGWDLRFFLGGLPPDHKFDIPMNSPGPTSIGPLTPSNSLKKVPLFTAPTKGDEIVLDCPDDYFGLLWKTQLSLKWALERGYGWIFRIFADTYVFPDRLADSRFYLHEFSGRAFECPPCEAHPDKPHFAPHGGMGYWTSREAAKLIVDAPPSHWGEDTHVGFVLWKAGIELFHDQRLMYVQNQAPEYNRSKLTIHLNERSQKWEPDLMRRTHSEQQAGRAKVPGWDGSCRNCQSTRMSIHPLGPRCLECGQGVGRESLRTA